MNGVVNIALTTLERQYKLPSSQSALIVSSTDIGAVLFVLVVSYLGAKGNRPKWIAIGSFLMAVGSFIFTIPHVASDPYEYVCKRFNPPPPKKKWDVHYLKTSKMLFWNNFDNSAFQSFKSFRLICSLINGTLLLSATSGNTSHVCSSSNSDPECLTQSGSSYLYVFMLAQFVHGIGFTPMFTLGTAYVDDNAPSTSTALYLGIPFKNYKIMI